MRMQRVLPLFVLIFLLVFMATKEDATAQQERLELVFAPGILEELNKVRAETRSGIKNKEIEDVRCLLGNKKGNRVYVTGLYRPVVSSATYIRVVTKLICPQNAQRKTVGWWHNHPSSSCRLSESDQKVSKRKSFQITMLHCSDKRWAWWSISQVRELSTPGSTLYPLPGQDLVNNNTK